MNEHKIAEYRNIHAGRTAIICGNGPSLERTPLARLGGHVLFGCNHIYKLFEARKFTVTYLAATDRNRLDELDYDILAGFRGAIFLGDHTRVDTPVRPVFSKLRAFVLLRQFPKKRFAVGVGRFLAERLLRGSLLKQLALNLRFMSDDLEHGLNYGESVIFSCIQLAWWMGCVRIVLVGVDANYSKGQYPKGIDEQIKYKYPFFMDNPRLMMEPLLTCFSIMLEESGVQLLDATVDGSLRCLPKIDVADLATSTVCF